MTAVTPTGSGARLAAGSAHSATSQDGGHRGKNLSTTSISLAEVYYGIERLPDGRPKEQFRATASDVFGRFSDRVLPFDAAVAGRYPLIAAARDAAGRPISGFDAQIAAICTVNGAGIATRNTRDFHGLGIDVIDPWDSGWSTG